MPCREKTLLETIKSFSKTNASTTTASHGEEAEEVKPPSCWIPCGVNRFSWHNAIENEKKKNATGTSNFGIRVYFYIFLIPKLRGQGKAGTRSIVWLIKNTKKALCNLSISFPTKTLHQGSPQQSTSQDICYQPCASTIFPCFPPVVPHNLLCRHITK